MAIYRGPGGSGDATTDATNQASVASDAAAAALVSQTAAANSATNAATSATAAASSASGASTSATNAASSATSAASSASTATTQAGIATTQATNAATSASNAATSAADAATTYDNFDDRYLGSKASAPTLDNDGNALLTGALYWNSTSNTMNVWTGSAWTGLGASSGVSSFNTRTGAITLSSSDVTTALTYTPLNPANNLSEVTASTARTNLSVPSTTGSGATGTWNIDILGNAGTVTNGVYTTGNQTIGGTKTFSSTISGSIDGNAATVTNGVVTTGSYANPSWITSLAETKVLPSQTGNSGKYLTTNGTSTSWATVTGGSASALDDLTDVVLTSPSTGQVLKYNGTNWINDTDATGSGAPGGSTTEVQYNNAGAFAGSANFTFNGTTVTTANDASISGLTVGKGSGAVATNTAVGLNALLANTTGAWNVGLGQAVLRFNTTGNANTAVGYFSQQQNISGTNNTSIGHLSLRFNTAGNFSTAIGDSALTNNTASNNTAVGAGALKANTTGQYNVAIGAGDSGGFEALRANTTASNNTAVGSGALGKNTTGALNAAFGFAALRENTTSSNNTGLGYQAGFAVTGANNTLVGNRAGYSGTNDLTTGSNNTIIGYLAAASSATVSNEITLGNASVTSLRVPGVSLYGTTTGIGIGTTNPSVKLDVIGSIEASVASTQDAIIIAGRAGGTSSYAATLTPTTLTASRTITIPDSTTTMVGTDTTQTLTNKRVTPRVSTTTSSATPTINTDNTDVFGLTAQAADITSFTTNLSGTPTDGQTLRIYIVGTAARAITWGASFEASTVSLPTTTVSTNRLDVGFLWNAATSKWRCVAVA